MFWMFLARHPSLAKALPGGASEAPEAPEAPAPPEPVVPDPEPPAQVGGMGWRDLDLEQDINRISTVIILCQACLCSEFLWLNIAG